MATSKRKNVSPASAAVVAAAPTTTKLQRHPLSEKFSLPTTDEERLALGLDIRVNGQQYDIITYEGMVLDGWERYMACLQQGITPRFKEYKGTSPAAVAFGTNAIRRKLNSVQKALFGAKYFVHMQAEGHAVTQKDVAKSACCSLTRLNEIVQLLRKVDTNEIAARCVAKLNTDADVTAAMLQNMLVEAGIVDLNDRKPAAPPAGARSDDGDDDGLDDLGDDSDRSVDMLGGADIDDLLDDDDDDVEGAPRKSNPEPRGDKGTKIGPDKRARETPASACARTFKALTEPERLDFVKFAWAMLRPAIETCIEQGRVEWPMLGASVDAGKAALADMASALAPTKGTKGKPAKAATKAASEPAPAPAKGKAAAVAKGAAKGKAAAPAKGKPAHWRGPKTAANA